MKHVKTEDVTRKFSTFTIRLSPTSSIILKYSLIEFIIIYYERQNPRDGVVISI